MIIYNAIIIQLMTDKKRVLREFEWFEVQTKVREIISEIMQPLEKKVISQATTITKLQESSRDEKYKMEQITLMINKDEDIFTNGIFQSVEEKFHNQTVLIRELEHKIEYLQGYINSKAQVLDKRLEESTEVLNGISTFKEYVKEELISQSQKIIESKNNVFDNFDSINKEITSIQISIDEVKSHHEGAIKRIDLNQQILTSSNHRLEQRLSQFYDSIKEVKGASEINSGRMVQMREQILKLKVFQKLISKFESLVNEQIIRVDNLQFKIEVIQPMVSFTQINEYAHHILPEKFHKNISIYFYNRYNQLVEEILNNQFEERRMTESAKGNMQLIKDVHKRATKLVFKLKKQELLKKGINLDHLSHEKKEEYLAGMKLEQNFRGLSENEQEEPKKVVVLTNAPKPTSEQIEIMAKELKEKINVELNDSKKYIENMEYLLKRDQEALEKNMNQIASTCSELSLNLHLQEKLHQQLSNSMETNFQELSEEFKNIKIAVKQIHDIMLVFNEIQKQDEKDRQAITLLGVRERHKDQFKQAYERKTNRSVVNLSNQCLSCSGNPNYYNEFFKMACLTYASSPVNYDNHTYERIEILDKLQHRLQIIHHTLFEKEKEGILGMETERKGRKQQDPYLYQKYGNSQIINLPSKDAFSVSDKFVARNVSSSQQFRSGSMGLKAPQQPRIIQPNELTSQILAKTRNRLFSRKLQKSFRESKSKKQSNSQERSDHMKNISRYFKDLTRQSEGIVKM